MFRKIEIGLVLTTLFGWAKSQFGVLTAVHCCGQASALLGVDWNKTEGVFLVVL